MRSPCAVLSVALCLPRADGLAIASGSEAASDSAGEQPGRWFEPLAWFHVPKTGSSFVNALFHTPGLWPGINKSFAVDSDHCKPGNVMHCHELHGINLSTACPGAFSKWAEHLGVGRDFERQYKGHGMAFMRQPEQRMLSHLHMSWPDAVVADQHLAEFRDMFQGCSVKMLVRDGFMHGTCGGDPPSQEEVDEAVARIKEFAFVGITEEWDLSMCLFRKMFGGECVGADFLNTRPGDMYGKATGQAEDEGDLFFDTYPTTQLNGWSDEADGQLYNAAIQKFEWLKMRYNVSQESCGPCWESKGKAWVPQDL